MGRDAMADVLMLDRDRDDTKEPGRLSDEMQVEVSLLSGRSCRIQITCHATVMELIREARKELKVKISRLYYQQQALRGSQPLLDLGRLQHVQLTAVAGDVQIISSSQAFCSGADAWTLAAANGAREASFLCILADGRVTTWGGLACSEKFCQELTDLCDVKSNAGAIAVLRPNGSVCSWGNTLYGAKRCAVKQQLQAEVRQIFSTAKAFAALKYDGTVVSWGGSNYENCGGDSSKVQQQLVNVKTIRATQSAFAALKEDGSVVTWGNTFEGGDSSRVAEQLAFGGQQLCATQRAFALAKEDGTVVTWGHSDEGGGSFQVQDDLHSVVELSATSSAFCARRSDGSLVCWGNAAQGGARTTMQGVVKVVGNDCAFAALLEDGSVFTWGDPTGGGASTAVSAELKGVVEIRPFFQCFVAILEDHSAVGWGHQRHGIFRDVADIAVNYLGAAVLKFDGSVEWMGDSRFDWVNEWLSENVSTLHMTAGAFAATKLSGKVVTWGGNRYGGDASSVRHILNGWDQEWDQEWYQEWDRLDQSMWDGLQLQLGPEQA